MFGQALDTVQVLILALTPHMNGTYGKLVQRSLASFSTLGYHHHKKRIESFLDNLQSHDNLKHAP